MTLEVIPYGAVSEIGGNKILVKDEEHTLMFDFGKNFGKENMYFDEFMKPRKLSACADYFDLGMLPKLKGIYRRDYMKRCGRWKPVPDPAVEAVLFSHAHIDHIGYAQYLRWDIPFIASQASFDIMNIFQEVGTSGENNFLEDKEEFQFYENNKGSYSRATKRKGAEIFHRKTIPVTGPFNHRGVEMHAHPVDHSLAGARAFTASIGGRNVVYTGDLRTHGLKGDRTLRFFDQLTSLERPIIITEGTKVTPSSEKGSHGENLEDMSEEEVRKAITERMAGEKGYVFVNWPERDTDRLDSMARGAEANGRHLLISMKQAKLLEELDGKEGAPKLDQFGIRILIPRKSWGAYKDPGYPDKIGIQDYSTWEREYLDHPLAVHVSEVNENPRDYAIRCTGYELNQLPDYSPEGGTYIYSVTEPFNDEMELDMERIMNWMKRYGLAMRKAHASGHISADELFQQILRLDRPTVIPIHTEFPQGFKVLPDVKMPEEGVPIKF